MAGEQDVFGIVNWIEQFLEEFSHHPVPAEFKISFLKRSYCTWNDHSLTSIFPFSPQIAAQVQILEFMKSNDNNGILSNSDMKRLEDEINNQLEGTLTYEAILPIFNGINNNLERNEESMRLYLDTKVWKRVRGDLECSNKIIHFGHYRGRTYRYKLTRPRIATGDIADLIGQILDGTKVEMTWDDIYTPLKELLGKIHIFAETEMPSDLVFSNQYRGIRGQYYAIPIAIESTFQDKGFKIVDFYLEDPLDYSGQFNSKLNLWIDNTYTKQWFNEQATQIKRYFQHRKVNAQRGTLRGLWRSTKTKSTKSQQKSNLYKSLARLSDDIEKLSRRFDQPEDRVALRQALQLQLDQLEEE